jgi:WD40 repeat protein
VVAGFGTSSNRIKEYEMREAIPANSDLRKELQEWLQFLRSECHILKDMPDLLFQQAANQPGSTAPARKANQWTEQRRDRQPWIQWVNKEQHRGQFELSLTGHNDSVLCCACSPNGMIVASGSSDMTLRLWRADNGQELAALPHSDGVISCGFSADGRLLVTGTYDGTLTVWDVDTQQRITMTKYSGSRICTCAFFANRYEILSLSGANMLDDPNPTVVDLWSVEEGFLTSLQSLHLGQLDPVRASAFSPDGKSLIMANYPNKQARFLKLIDLQTGRQLALFDHQEEVIHCVFSPDGQHILSSTSANKDLCLWNSNTRGDTMFPEQKLSGHESAASKCAFSRDGKWIVSASSDSSIRIWDSETGEQAAILTGVDSSIDQCIFLNDAQRVLFSTNKDLKVWKWHRGEALHVADEGKQRVMTFSSDARRLLTAGKFEMKIHETENGQEIATLRQGSTVDACCFSPDSRRIVSLSSFLSTVFLWNAETAQLSASLHAKPPVFFTLDSKWLIATGWDGNLTVWSTETGEQASGENEGLARREEQVEAITLDSRRGHVLDSWHSSDGRFGVSFDSFATCLRVEETPAKRDVVPRFVTRIAGLSPFTALLNDDYLLTAGRIEKLEWRNAPYRGDVIRQEILKIWDTANWKVSGMFYAQSPLELDTIKISKRYVAVSDQSGRTYILRLIGFKENPPRVTLVRDDEKQDHQIAANCKSCGGQFIPASDVIQVIEDIKVSARNTELELLGKNKIVRIGNRIKGFFKDPDAGSRNILPAEAWEDLRLSGQCPHCKEPLRFNPFIIDKNDARYDWLR